MSDGKKTRLFVSTTGATASTPLVEVEFQGDLSITTGKTAERTAFKNGAMTGIGNSGWQATFTMGARVPVPTGQAEIMEAHDNETPLHIEIKGETGSRKYSGVVKVVVDDDNAPVSGPRIYSVTLSEDGQITPGVVS